MAKPIESAVNPSAATSYRENNDVVRATVKSFRAARQNSQAAGLARARMEIVAPEGCYGVVKETLNSAILRYLTAKFPDPTKIVGAELEFKPATRFNDDGSFVPIVTAERDGQPSLRVLSLSIVEDVTDWGATLGMDVDTAVSAAEVQEQERRATRKAEAEAASETGRESLQELN